MRLYKCAVYILANEDNSVLYIGVTSDLENRVAQHREGIFEKSFTTKFNAKKLVYFEEADDIVAAIEREKQLKRWSRKKKEWLISLTNPRWNDLLPSEEYRECRLDI